MQYPNSLESCEQQSRRSRTLIRVAGLSGAALLAIAAHEASAQTTSAATDQTTPDKADTSGQTADTPAPAPAPIGDDIVVTGFRASIADAIALKRNSQEIVEVVSAEDIGKLPDVSIAESLARLPGIAGQRVNGRVQVLSVRGLPPDFTLTLLNGRQQVSTGDNRNVEFDQYPSELVNQAVVYKTSNAALVNQGIAATVDLRTVRPLDYNKRIVTVNARGEANDLGKLNADGQTRGFRVSGSYIDQFFDDTLGVAVGYAHLDSPAVVARTSNYYWGLGYGVFGPGNDDLLNLGGVEIFARNRSQVRDSGLATIEWRPSSNLKSTIDAFYSHFDQKEVLRGIQWTQDAALGAFSSDPVTYPSFTVATVGQTRYTPTGTVTGITPVVRNDLLKDKSDLFAIGWNTQFTTGRTKLALDVNYSQAKVNSMRLETYAGYGLSGSIPPLASGAPSRASGTPNRSFDRINYNISLDNERPQFSTGFDYANANQVYLGDPAAWGGWGHEGSLFFPHTSDRLVGGELKLTQNFKDTGIGSILPDVEIGASYYDREKSRSIGDFNLFTSANRTPELVNSAYLIAPTNLSFAGLGPTLAFDAQQVLDNQLIRTPILDANHYGSQWRVNERIWTPYIKGNIGAELGGVKLTGNIGVQAVIVKQSSTGFSTQPQADRVDVATPTAFTTGASYTDIAPSFNLVANFGDGWIVRAGAARTLARPRLDDLRAGRSASVDTSSRSISGSGGNPLLKPWKANAFDLTVEKYLSKDSYVAVAGYYKNLLTYIYNSTVPYDFTGFPIPAGSPAPLSFNGLFNQPVNGQGGKLYGVEVSGSIDFGTFAESLHGIGVQGSYAYTETTIKPEGPFNNTQLPGLSKEVNDITGYFERGGFSARISRRWRSGFRGQVIQNFARIGFVQILPDEQVDAQMSYRFDTGLLQGATLLFQVNNLTDASYRTSTGPYGTDEQRQLEAYETYGRQFIFGLSYKF